MTTTSTATATATATASKYTVTVEGKVIAFNSPSRDYAFVVVAWQGPRGGWTVRLKTNSESAARTKQAKQLALGDHVLCLIVPVEHR